MKDSKFHIVITDNESGETVLDVDTRAFIGGLVVNGTEAQSVVLANCNSKALACAVVSAREAVEATLERKKDDLMFALALYLEERSLTPFETIDRSEGGVEE